MLFLLLNLNLKLVANFYDVEMFVAQTGATALQYLLNINPAEAACNPCAVTYVSWGICEGPVFGTETQV